MTERRKYKGISEPFGLVLAVLIPVVLILIIFFWAWVYATDIMHHQEAQIVAAGTPYAHYFPSNNSLKELVIVVHNPMPHSVEIRGVIIKGNYIELGISVPPKKNYRIDIDLRPYGIVLSQRDVDSGYMEFVIVTNLGTLTVYAQLHPYG